MMQEITIDEEFRNLLPVIDKDTYTLLKDSILHYGCWSPLVLWNGILVDGYNRYGICTEYSIPFETVEMEFDSREDVLIWIISNQVARRNLTPIQLSYFRGLHYKADRKVQGTNNQFALKSEKPQNEVFHGSTSSRLAKQYNVSRATIERDARVAEAINAIGEESPEIKREILAGATGISRKQLQELSSGSADDLKEVVAKIEDGTFERRRVSVVSGAVGEREPDDSDDELVLMGPYEMLINGIADEFYTELRRFSRLRDTEAFKMALRSAIDSLEYLYRQL